MEGAIQLSPKNKKIMKKNFCFIRVGDAEVSGRNPRDCERLVAQASKLAENQPVTIVHSGSTIKTGNMEQATNSTKVTGVLSNQAPVSIRTPLGSVTGSSMVKTGACLLATELVYWGIKWTYKWVCNKYFKKDEPVSELPDLSDDDDVETQAEGSNVTDSESGINLQGSSSDDLFSRPSTDDDSKWVVCGYMKVGQVNLIVAGGGVGKTIIMVQIALAVAKGTRPEFLPDECCASVKLPVFYYRLEDFSDELAGKYGKGKVFNGSSITWFLPRDLKEFSLNGFIEHLKTLAERLTEDSLVCIDPATKLGGYKHSEFIKGVEDAKAIANERGFILTPVATIHLDEIEDWKYLSLNNIKGGDKALQLAGSVTAIRRERTDLDHRFLQSLKEPKGSPKPFYGNVLVCKAVEEELDENNRYLHYEFECIKEETLARPEKPKAQADDKEYDSVPPKPSTPPNQKITPEILKIIQEGLRKGMKVKDIAVQIWKRAKVQLNEDYLRKFIKNNFE